MSVNESFEDDPEAFENWFLYSRDPVTESSFNEGPGFHVMGPIGEDALRLRNPRAEEVVPEVRYRRFLRRGRKSAGRLPVVHWVYHATTLAGLASILASGEIRSPSGGGAEPPFPFERERRRSLRLELESGVLKSLDDLVAFRFLAVCPTVFSFCREQPDRAADLVVLAASLSEIADEIPVALTDGDPLDLTTVSYPTIEYLNAIDLRLARSGGWRRDDLNRSVDSELRRRLGAELLAAQPIPFRMIRSVGCLDEVLVPQVRQLLEGQCSVAFVDWNPLISPAMEEELALVDDEVAELVRAMSGGGATDFVAGFEYHGRPLEVAWPGLRVAVLPRGEPGFSDDGWDARAVGDWGLEDLKRVIKQRS